MRRGVEMRWIRRRVKDERISKETFVYGAWSLVSVVKEFKVYLCLTSVRIGLLLYDLTTLCERSHALRYVSVPRSRTLRVHNLRRVMG